MRSHHHQLCITAVSDIRCRESWEPGRSVEEPSRVSAVDWRRRRYKQLLWYLHYTDPDRAVVIAPWYGRLRSALSTRESGRRLLGRCYSGPSVL